jgi:isopentenyl diphosphate isomerase/L-lactate dehydrogenase-like FMN-dependent dehydrogenase
MAGVIHELKVTMLCAGAADLAALRQTSLVRAR